MESPAVIASVAEIGTGERRLAPSRSTALWVLAGLVALGAAVRFASLGVQSYHHDEVITVARVIPGSFTNMLDEVKRGESNPPLYYMLVWAWAKWFGTGEVAIRSLSALFGLATIPLAYLVGAELSQRRAGLIAAGIVAINPMLIWYSQEARSYAVLVFFCTASLLFFVRALRDVPPESGHYGYLRDGTSRDLAFWALLSALALCSHYFAVFAVGIEAAWLLIALRERWRSVVPAVTGVALVGAALIPLISAQVNPTHIGWIDHSLLSTRFLETGVSFLIGETGHVIAEPPRERYALLPVILVGAALILVAVRGTATQRRGALIGTVVGVGVAALAALAAAIGKDYVVERNLLPALVPLAVAAAIGFAADGARRLGLLLAVVLGAYWLAFDVHVTQTPNLQRPDFRTLTEELGPVTHPRAIVSWKLAADPIRFYLHDGSRRVYGGELPLREIDVISKPVVTIPPRSLPPGFHPVERRRLDRLTLTRYMSRRDRGVPFPLIANLSTGFGSNAVVVDGPPEVHR